MKKRINQFAVVTDSNKVVKKIGHSTILQPKTCFKGEPTKWFDDSKLIKPEYRK